MRTTIKLFTISHLGVGSEWFWQHWTNNNSVQTQFMEDYYPPKFTYQDFGVELKIEFFDAEWFASLIKDSGARYTFRTI